MSTNTLGRTVRFLADKPGLRLIRQSQGERFLPNGQVVPDPSMPEVDYQFVRGALEVREGQDVLADTVDPETGEIRERDVVTYLREHPWYGQEIHEVPRDSMAPDSAPLYQEIGRLEAQGDIEGLIALGDAEDAEWGREAVLGAIRDALGRLDPPPEAA